MTVSTVVDHNDYTGNGVTTSFPYTFRIFKKTDLAVSVVDLSENITVLVLDTDYTVTNAGGYNGGSVVLTTPLTNGWQISISRELEPTQETDLRNQGKFFAEVHEDAFDKLTMLIQQAYSVFRLALRKPSSIANWYDALNNYIRNLRDPRDPQDAATKNYVDTLASGNLSRTLRVPEPINQLPGADDRRNKIPAFDNDGNAIVILPPDGSASDVLIELAKPGGDKKIGSSYGESVWADYERCEFQRKGTFADGGSVSGIMQVMQDNTGLWWFYTGSFPKLVLPGTSPTSDPLWYCAGLLNGKEITDLSSWCDTLSNVDVTFEMQQYFRTLGYLGLKAFGTGDVIVSSRITIPNVEFDFSNLTITIDPNSDSSVSGSSGKILYLIDPETVELTGQSFTTSNIGQLATIQLSGSAYRNRTVGIEGEGDSNRAYLRGTFGTYTQAADLYVVDDSGSGYHGDTPALFKYNGTAKHVIRPLRPEMVVRGPTFVLPSPLSGSRSLRCCIQIERNGVTLIGGTINSQSSGLLVESYVSLRNVTDCSVIDVNMLNNNTQASYVVLAYCTNRLLVQRCRSLSGWALVDGNFMRNTVVTDSYGATIGCHAMAWNFTVERCTLGATLVNGIYQGGVSLTGGGDLNVKRCQYWYRGGDRYLDHPVSTRGDYGQAWEGNINIEDMDIYMYEQPPVGQGLACLYLNGADFGSTDLTRDCYLGKKISIKRVRLKVMSAAWAADRIVFNPVWFQTTYTQNVRYPSEYLVEDLSLETSGPGWTMDPRWPSVISHPMAVIGTTKSTLRRCQLNQGNTSNMVFISAAAATAYRVTAELLVEDCYGTLYAGISLPAGNSLTIRRTNIGGLPIGNANSAGTIKIERCTINGTVCGGSTGADIIYFYENHITTTNPVTVGTLAKYCHGNTVPAGGGILGRSVDEWYSYRDSSIFRTT